MEKIEIAKEVLRIRISQILINEEYKAGKFKIPVHLAMGHEAIAVALNHVLKNEDRLILTHRNMEYNLARLGKLRPILDEYLLRPTGLMQGRLGSMNVINPARGIIYSSSILGNNFPVSAGVAMAQKMMEKVGVVFVLGGDGSIEEGAFYEALTMMKTLGLRVILIIENNEWSLGTHISERRCPIDLQKITAGFNIRYLKLEGNQTEKYIEILSGIREEVLRNDDPVCIEVALKTLGDRHDVPTPEYPEGRYINYHAGPTQTVDVTKHFPGGILKENEDDPVFVLGQELGREKIIELSHEVMKGLQDELK